jgi:ribosome-associated protein
MSRKLKKGYYVRGLFVAEGSALDLEYKRELKGTDEPTRTDLKKESDALQKLGEDLLTLRAELLTKLDLPDKLVDGVAEAKRITNFEGKRRQMQFIGKLMRKLDPAKWDEIRAALEEQHMPSVQETMVLHQAEQWRDRLIADDDAVGQWLNISPDTDSQQLRALVRQARKDAKPEKPGEAVRHGRSYREIFQLVREALLANQEASQSAAADNDVEDGDED